MYTADLHCDVISKMLQHPGLSLLQPDDRLDVTVERLKEGGVALQVFALYLPDSLPKNPESVFRAAELYWSGVLSHPELRPVTRSSDLDTAAFPGKIGALLSLEGADGLQGNLWALRLLHRLGLRLLGPTWNHANWACDGATEPRGGGLTKAGKQLVAECEALGILLDVSHLSDRGFWDLADLASRPFFASHSNARALTSQARNLTDEQIRALAAVDGIMGVTFVPWFLTAQEPARIDDILRHVEYVCSLAGARHVAFGSDFDGVERHVRGLANPGQYPALANALLKRYPEEQVRGFMGGNARRFFAKNLPN
ncbi:membrane dipeptidase [Cohnella sp. CFH 77786]|uniref:dipeptidase n=1 Tax=Cohnella sp. CFH 77786 TaxID=2662265 RepID=UPI001C60DDC6|nr:dipeptidase [Cohnella sp. CFH 77786]MBW5444494.1 membrane dipeptidase [Cohnella sp. CFH 77786]